MAARRSLGERPLLTANPRRKWQAAFLAALEGTGTITHAAKAARMGRRTVCDYRRTDPAFVEGCANAFEGATNNLEAGVARRAAEGEHEPVYVQGKVAGHKTRTNDRLLRFAIRSLWQRCDRLEREHRLGESEAQSEKSWPNFLDGKLSIEVLAGISPGHGRLERIQTDAPPTSRAILHRPGLYAMKPAGGFQLGIRSQF